MKGEKGLMGLCKENAKGEKGEMGPKGDSCVADVGAQTRGNESYIGPKGEKGMIGMKVMNLLICLLFIKVIANSRMRKCRLV